MQEIVAKICLEMTTEDEILGIKNLEIKTNRSGTNYGQQKMVILEYAKNFKGTRIHIKKDYSS